jgi:hypothetical protein
VRTHYETSIPSPHTPLTTICPINLTHFSRLSLSLYNNPWFILYLVSLTPTVNHFLLRLRIVTSMLSLILVGMYLYRTAHDSSAASSMNMFRSYDRLSMHKSLQMVLPYFAPIAVIMIALSVIFVFVESEDVLTLPYTFQICVFAITGVVIGVTSVISLKKLLHIAESTQNSALQTYVHNLKVCVKSIYLSVSSSLGITFLHIKSMTFRPFPLFVIVLLLCAVLLQLPSCSPSSYNDG